MIVMRWLTGVPAGLKLKYSWAASWLASSKIPTPLPRQA